MNTQSGRSMVEMLGVLAIIGVLSVGAISGYSKAMFKYKLNKHAEQYNTLINAVARNAYSFDNLYTAGTQDITAYFMKMGEIPQEMIKNNHVYDIFNQKCVIALNINSTNNQKSINLSVIADSSLKTKSAESLEICRNMLITAKENSANIYSLLTASGNPNNNRNAQWLFGDNSCGFGNTCLKNITLDDIYRICTSHTGASESVVFEIEWLR